jgi:outer membrane protein
MKKLSLILNIALALALVALYILHFTGIATSKNKKTSTENVAGNLGSGSIFYVQIDTVLSKFNMAIDLSGELESKFKSSDTELQLKQKSYQNDINDYQYKAQRGLITRSEAQNIEQQLYNKQQALLKLQQDLTQEINEQQAVMNRKVINAIMEYLKEHSSQFNYKYVLGTSFGGNILYANDSLDITYNIIKGLNEKYQQSKKKE